MADQLNFKKKDYTIEIWCFLSSQFSSTLQIWSLLLHTSTLDKAKHFVKKLLDSNLKLTYSYPLKFMWIFSQYNRKAYVLLQIPFSNNVTLLSKSQLPDDKHPYFLCHFHPSLMSHQIEIVTLLFFFINLQLRTDK